MPSQDPKLLEISRLKTKLLEVETQLKEEKKTANRLREVSEKKNEQVNIVDAEITAEMERFRWKREEAIFLMRTTEEESKARVKAMKQQEKEILQQIADFDLQTNENNKLSARLKTLSLEYRTTTKDQIEERNSRTKKNFETRMAMEEIMRKMVRNVDSSYERDAITKMQKEANQANAENDKIHREFDIREAKTEALIRQQQTSYDLLMRLRIELDMMIVATDIQEKNIIKQIKSNQAAEREVIGTSARVQSLRDQVSALQLAFRGKISLEQQIKDISEKTGELNQEVQTVRRKSIQLCHKIIGECFQIADKGRLRFSKQITRQLNELSAATENAVTSTPIHGADLATLSSATFKAQKFIDNASTENYSEQVGNDQLWRSSGHSSLHRASKPPPSSFSMMFSG